MSILIKTQLFMAPNQNTKINKEVGYRKNFGKTKIWQT